MIHTYLIRKWPARCHTWKGLAIPVLIAILTISCEKQRVIEGNPASLQVFNATDDGLELRANLTGRHPIPYFNTLKIDNRKVAKMLISDAEVPVAFYAGADTLPQNTPVWNNNMRLETGRIYTLFLFGEKKSVAHILKEERFAGNRADDSVTHVRFVNMSEGQQVSVNLKGSAAGTLAGNLSFKDITEFTMLKVDKSVASYEFEFRDAVTGVLLGSFMASDIGNYMRGNIYLNASWSLVLVGKPGGTGLNAQRIIKIQHV